MSAMAILPTGPVITALYRLLSVCSYSVRVNILLYIINIHMNAFTVNGRTYTRLFAWLPERSFEGELIWLTHYYMRPDRHGQGHILTWEDFQREIILG